MEHFRRHAFLWHLLYWPVYLIARLRLGYRPRRRRIPAPSLVVSNHCTDWDPMLLGLTVRRQTYFVASEHIFRNPTVARLLLWAQAPIARMKGVTASDTALTAVRRLRKGRCVAVFAEGNRTYNGLTSAIVESTAKLARVSGASLVTHRFRGGYLTSPRWAGASIRRGRLTGEIVNVYPPEKLKKMTPAQIAEIIREDIFEDAYATQEAWRVPYKGRRLAEHLERALYLCPGCRGMNTLESRDDILSCRACGLTARYTPLGYLESDALPFRTVTQWDIWQAGELPGVVSAAGDGPIVSDEAVELVEVSEQSVETSLGTGTLTAWRDRLECAGTVIPYADITGINLNGPQTLMLTAAERHLTLRSARVCNMRKYVSLYRAAADPEHILDI